MRVFGVIASLGLVAGAGCAPDRSGGEAVQRFAQAHRDADAAQARGDLLAARARLETALSQPMPELMAADDRRILIQDASFHLAELQLPAIPARAEEVTTQALALGGSDLFAANLLAVRGRARELLRRDAAAADDLHRALEINARMLSTAVRSGGRP